MISESPAPKTELGDQIMTKEIIYSRRQLSKKWVLTASLMLVLFASVAYIGLNLLQKSPSHINGTPECISWVKKIEGNKFSGIYELDCKLTPNKIGNSNLTSQYLEYSGTPKDPDVCSDHLGMFPGYEESQYCVDFHGSVLSDGSVHRTQFSGEQIIPRKFDFCYSSTSSTVDILPKPRPTTQDLYFYDGKLQDRVVFDNTEVKTAFGTCVLNGTSLYVSSEEGGFYEQLTTNVTVQYKDFPKDCYSVTIGRSLSDLSQCTQLVTSAKEDIGVCYSNKSPVITNDKITGFKTEWPYDVQYLDPNCESSYVQRMAALNKCEEIVSDKLRAQCLPLVSHPSEETTRVTKSL